jgi:hypothetical protein
MKDLSPGEKYTLELINLLQEIVTMFDDANSRPDGKIALYERYRELQKTHHVKLAGRFIVILGGNKNSAPRHRSNSHVRPGANQLRLAQQPQNRESGCAFSASET